MKRFFITRFVVAGVALLTVPTAFAQNENPKEKTDVQQIIITRKGNTNEKINVEINGDKVIVNGKDVKDDDNKDVNVRISKVKDINALRGSLTMAPRVRDFNFEFDHNNNHISFFREDSSRAMLGVVTEGDDKGARISSVSKESAAEKAGLKEGDIITKVDDQKVEDADDVTKAIRKQKPGTKVAITYLRDGKEQKATAELDRWKGVRMNGENFNLNIPEFRMPYIPGSGPRLGLSVQDTEDGKGVKVLEIDEDGNAAKAGIKEGDIITQINDEAVSGADEIARKVRANKDQASMRLQVLRNGKSQNIEVKIPRKLKTTDL